MRAYDIAMWLIILQASIGFINAIGLFETQYYATPQNAYNYEIQDLDEYKVLTDNPGVLDYTRMGINWAWEGLVVIFKIIFSIVIIYPMLIKEFGIPAVLSVFLQATVYVVYAVGYKQWKSGKGMAYYE